MDLTVWDLTWLLPVISVVSVIFRFRSFLFASLFSFWKSLENDVNAFCLRHFPPPPLFVLPPNWTAISAQDINALNLFADAIQRRINCLRMTKINFVRSRTGIVYHLNACSMLQTQLVQALRALADERSSHEATKGFLQHKSNARPDGETDLEQLRAQLEELKAQLAAEESELGEDAQTEEVEEIEKESPAADEINSPPMAPQPEDTDPQIQTVDESAQTIARLTKELEDLQAEYNELEDQSDTWRKEFEELEKAQEEAAGDQEHHESRIGALETQLGIERTSRKEAQAAADGLRDQNEKLREELQESKAQRESLRTAYQAEERANEEKAAELTNLQAENERLRAEVTDLRQRATSTLDGSAPEFVPSTSPSINQPTTSLETTRPSNSWADAVEDESEFSGIPDFEINGSFVEDPFHGEDPFPEITGPEPTPAPSATGPGQARNAHVRKLNEEMMRREWRGKSGMASSADEEEGHAGPADVLDDMYDRQVTRALASPLTRYARGSTFGALNDIPSPVESVSAASTPSRRSRASRQSHGDGEEATGRSSGMPIMLGGYEVTRGDASAGSASEAPKEEEIANADGGLAGIEGGEGTEDEKPEEDGPEEEEPKAEEETSSIDSRRSPCSPAAAHDVSRQAAPVTRGRLPSNYWPEVEEQPRTHNERVGDAIADAVDELARERGLGSLRESRWAQQKPRAEEKKKKPEEAPTPAKKATGSETPSSPVPQQRRTNHPAAAATGDREPSAPQEAPSSTPFSPDQKTHAEQVGDALADFIDQQAPHSTPLTGSIWATTPTSAGSHARDPSSTSTNQRGRGRGHRDGIRGGGPSTPAPVTPGSAHSNPLPSQPATAGSGAQGPGSYQRGGGRGRGRGRGGHTTAPAARGGGGSSVASDSFRRLQERMAAERGGK